MAGFAVFTGFGTALSLGTATIYSYGECLIRTATTNGILMLTFTPLAGLTETVLQFLPDMWLGDS